MVEPSWSNICEVSGATLERPTSQMSMLCISSVLRCLRLSCAVSICRSQGLKGSQAYSPMVLSTSPHSIDGHEHRPRNPECKATMVHHKGRDEPRYPDCSSQRLGAPGYPDCDRPKEWVHQDTPIVQTQCSGHQAVALDDDVPQFDRHILCNDFHQCNPV